MTKLRGWVELDKSRLTPVDVQAMKRDLTVYPPKASVSFGNGVPDPPALLYEEDALHFRVPRAYAFDERPDLVDNCQDCAMNGDPQTFAWVGDVEHRRRALAAGKPDWADKQIKWVDGLYDALQKSPYHGAIGQAPTSFGKTISMCRLIAKIGTTTLVVVHKDFLVDQWMDAAKKWLGLTDAEIGTVRGPVCDFSGKKLVIAMVESICSRREKYGSDFYDYFGLVIADETHRMGADQWSQAIPMFGAKYRVGVSATPRRRDGMDKAFFWHIGPIAVAEKDWYITAQVYQIGWDTYLPAHEYLNRWNGKVNLAKLVTLLSEMGKYNDFLVNEIKRAADKGRKILVLSDRREHLTALKDGFDNLCGGHYATGFYWGETVKKPKKGTVAPEDCDVLFGTFGKAKEGLDIPSLDTLFLTTPRSDVEQDAGRILRVCETKRPPLIVDVIHVGVPIAEAFSRKRERLYKTKGFEIKRVGQ